MLSGARDGFELVVLCDRSLAVGETASQIFGASRRLFGLLIEKMQEPDEITVGRR
jgi:hypothetical protein